MRDDRRELNRFHLFCLLEYIYIFFLSVILLSFPLLRSSTAASHRISVHVHTYLDSSLLLVRRKSIVVAVLEAGGCCRGGFRRDEMMSTSSALCLPIF